MTGLFERLAARAVGTEMAAALRTPTLFEQTGRRRDPPADRSLAAIDEIEFSDDRSREIRNPWTGLGMPDATDRQPTVSWPGHRAAAPPPAEPAVSPLASRPGRALPPTRQVSQRAARHVPGSRPADGPRDDVSLETPTTPDVRPATALRPVRRAAEPPTLLPTAPETRGESRDARDAGEGALEPLTSSAASREASARVQHEAEAHALRRPDPVELVRDHVLPLLVESRVIPAHEAFDVVDASERGPARAPDRSRLLVESGGSDGGAGVADTGGAESRPPDVHVHIDRIEVQRRAPDKASGPRRQAISEPDHEAYLADRRGSAR
jgi:hypothetical protein